MRASGRSVLPAEAVYHPSCSGLVEELDNLVGEWRQNPVGVLRTFASVLDVKASGRTGPQGRSACTAAHPSVLTVGNPAIGCAGAVAMAPNSVCCPIALSQVRLGATSGPYRRIRAHFAPWSGKRIANSRSVGPLKQCVDRALQWSEFVFDHVHDDGMVGVEVAVSQVFVDRVDRS